ncbi:MAG: hypothetical protein JXA21_22805 [Anaerolineae bacterium]|nr:hypothetical protein [Anaerolineae bacterium]
MKQPESYYVEQHGEEWTVRYRKAGSVVVLCRTDDPSAAQNIQLAMSILPYAREAAGELADEVPHGPGQQALVSTFSRLKALERKAAAQRDFESCLSNLGQTFLAILAGIGGLVLIVTIFRYFFLR